MLDKNLWVNEEMLNAEADRFFHHSDYRSVPYDWLGPQFFEDAEKLKARNERAYHHEYLGEVTRTGGTVFENVVQQAFMKDDLQ